MKFTAGMCFLAVVCLAVRSYPVDANSTAGVIISVAILAFAVLGVYFGEQK